MIFANELYHHGIKGQQWGVRRFQYQDGSLTPAGAKRYNGPSANVASPRKKHVTGTVSDISKGSPAGTNPVGMAGGGGGGGSDEEDEEEKKKLLQMMRERYPGKSDAELTKMMADEKFVKSAQEKAAKDEAARNAEKRAAAENAKDNIPQTYLDPKWSFEGASLAENTNIENVKAQAQQQYNQQQAEKAKTTSYKVSRALQSVGNAVDKMTGARDRKDIEAHARTVNASVRDASRATLDAADASYDYVKSRGSQKSVNRYNTAAKAFNNADSNYSKSTEKMYNSAQKYSKSPEYKVKRVGEAAKNLVKNVKNSIGGSSHATSVKPTVADYSGTLTTGSSSTSSVSNNTVSTGETSVLDWLKRRVP